jgi:hypothetical protein
VHIVTDNGSNYKKACKALGREFADITWTPCLAHTVNLMLKDIGERAEHAGVILSCKRISAWLHNHGQLNAMMRKAIGCTCSGLVDDVRWIYSIVAVPCIAACFTVCFLKWM